jgi:SAM-dependent methyltransferase
MLEDPKRIVQHGYNQLGPAYRLHFEKENPQRYKDCLAGLIQTLPVDAEVLELGCADGIPAAENLSRYFNYLGVDISPVQVESARRNVPAARFELGDMAMLSFSDATFDGIVALYSIIHLPLAEQPALLKSIWNWLKPGGYFLGVLGAAQWTGTEVDWLKPGVNMYWSHTDAATYQARFNEIGFTTVEKYFIPEGQAGHTYFLLRK